MKIQYAVGFLISAVATNTVFAEQQIDEPKILRVPLTKKSTTALRKRDGSSGALYNDNGSIYLVNVAIGTPVQNFELALDTGSADLWVPGSQCPSSVCPLAKFYEKNSTTYKATTEPFNITYGIGAASGIYAQETITIAGATVQQQQFGYVTASQNILTEMKTLNGQSYTPTVSSADNATTFASDMRMDGIFGLGYPFITAPTNNLYNPFFFNLKAQNKISQNVFSIFLNSSESYGNSGEIIFGGVDSTKYTGDITYLPVAKTTRRSSAFAAGTSDYGYWQVYGQGVGVVNGVGKNVALTFDSTTSFVFDTGTTLSYLPTNVLQPLLTAAVGTSNLAYDSANNYFQIRCSLAKQNTTIQIMMSNSANVTSTPVVLNVPLADLIFPMDTDYVSSAKVCMFGIVPSSGTIFMGESILRSVYQIYDADQNRIGIAGAVGSGAYISNGTGTSSGSNSGNSNSNSSSNGNTSSSGVITAKANIMTTLIGLSFTFYILQ